MNNVKQRRIYSVLRGIAIAAPVLGLANLAVAAAQYSITKEEFARALDENTLPHLTTAVARLTSNQTIDFAITIPVFIGEVLGGIDGREAAYSERDRIFKPIRAGDHSLR